MIITCSSPAARCMLIASASVVLLSGCGGAGPEVETPAAAVHAAYVLFAPPGDGQSSPQAVARVIVDGQDAACPDLTGGSANIPTQPRNNPHGFPVTVCEALAPLNRALTVEGTSFSLPAAALDFDSLVIFGDTGCSDCTGPAPNLAANASAAAALRPPPGVVLHVGDYNYRGTRYYQYEGAPCSRIRTLVLSRGLLTGEDRTPISLNGGRGK